MERFENNKFKKQTTHPLTRNSPSTGRQILCMKNYVLAFYMCVTMLYTKLLHVCSCAVHQTSTSATVLAMKRGWGKIQSTVATLSEES